MFSAMFVVKAMTSWFVVCSISEMRAASAAAWSRIHCASSRVIPHWPSSACASHAKTSISRQISNLFWKSQILPISSRVYLSII